MASLYRPFFASLIQADPFQLHTAFTNVFFKKAAKLGKLELWAPIARFIIIYAASFSLFKGTSFAHLVYP